MPIHCATLQSKLLSLRTQEAPREGLGAALSQAEQKHLAECAECQAFWAVARAVAPGMEELGGVARQRGAYSPAGAAALKARVLVRCQEKLEAGRAVRRGRLGFGLGWLTPRPAAGWALALGAVILLGLSIFGNSQPIGKITFAQAGLKIEKLAVSGLVNQALARGAHLATSSAGGAIAELDGSNQIRLALAPDTQLELDGPRVLRLRQGAVWLNVNPKGRGFKVLTPYGEVVVTGTVFGVSASENRFQVEVTRGQVKVYQGGSLQAVNVGQEVTGTAQAVTQPAPRPMGTALPQWVDQLSQAEELARAARLIPSLSVRKQKEAQ